MKFYADTPPPPNTTRPLFHEEAPTYADPDPSATHQSACHHSSLELAFSFIPTVSPTAFGVLAATLLPLEGGVARGTLVGRFVWTCERPLLGVTELAAEGGMPAAKDSSNTGRACELLGRL